MRASQFFVSTLKEAPANAEVVSQKLMLRAGMIKRLAAGIYSWMPMGLRVVRKVERIVREEMDRAGAIELFMPAVQPGELWQESGRWEKYGPEPQNVGIAPGLDGQPGWQPFDRRRPPGAVAAPDFGRRADDPLCRAGRRELDPHPRRQAIANRRERGPGLDPLAEGNLPAFERAPDLFNHLAIDFLSRTDHGAPR